MSTAHPDDDALVAHTLGELDPAARAEVDEHLDGCEACRVVVARLRAAVEAYRAAEPVEAPARVLADLLEAQAQQRARRAGWARRLRPVYVAAGLIAIAGAFASGLWVGRSVAPGSRAAGAADTSRSGAPAPARLPKRPVIEFRAEPPLETRLALAAESSFVGIPGGGIKRDSL
jgi:anti-sigma factor RsiW